MAGLPFKAQKNMEVGLEKRNNDSSNGRNSPVNTILFLGDVDTD